MSTTRSKPGDAVPNTQLSERVHKIRHRISMLRVYLAEKALDTCLIPSSDPHQSEYLANHWKFREFLSGFTGSSGTLVVSTQSAGLWTDSRYFLQAEAELADTGIDLYKLGLPGTPSIEEWIIMNGCHHIGLDGWLYASSEVSRLNQYLAGASVTLHTDFNPYSKVWPDQPPLPHEPAWVLPLSANGEPTDNKLNRVRQAIRDAGAEALTLTELDEIAWLLNIRGADIEFNPVVMAFAYVDSTRCILFTEASKIGPDVDDQLNNASVERASYEDILPFISRLKNLRLLVDSTRLNHELHKHIDDSCVLIEGQSPVKKLKAIKNVVEIGGFRLAMRKDGAAWVRLLIWLEQVTATHENANVNSPTEFDVGEKAASLRKMDEAYIGESFAPIAAFCDHGAIVHYEAEPQGSYPLQGEGALLMDLGAHYRHGTTDTTRTIYLNGIPSDAFKADYTCLLKGLIDLSTAIFPEGTRGSQLDVLARRHLWDRQLNFLHGTGHGIGHCLYVHEGPQSIRMNENPVCLEPGMVLSNEPGLYRTGEYGIRLENVLQVVKKGSSAFGTFFAFESLTLVPFDLECIDRNLLEPQQEAWLDAYHERVYEQLSPLLNVEERIWLRKKTQALSTHTY